MRAHITTLVLDTDRAREFAGLNGIRPPTECRDTLQDLRGVLGFVEIDGLKNIVVRKT